METTDDVVESLMAKYYKLNVDTHAILLYCEVLGEKISQAAFNSMKWAFDQKRQALKEVIEEIAELIPEEDFIPWESLLGRAKHEARVRTGIFDPISLN